MNTGIIASRYALALFKRVSETGNTAAVAAQARRLLTALEAKDASAEGVQLDDELARFVELVLANRRQKMLPLMLRDFLARCDRAEGLLRLRLTMAFPDDALERRLEGLFAQKTGLRPVLTTEVRPELIGGFLLECEDRLLDASVRHALDTIRDQLSARNRRIV